MAASKTLKASIVIGGTVTGSLKSSLGQTQISLKRIGGEIANIDRRQRLVARQIDVFGKMGKGVDHLRREYSQLTAQADRLRVSQERLGRAQERIDRNSARRQALGSKLRGAVGGALAVALPVGAAVRSGAEFERESALIGATANMTRAQVTAMNRAILGTSAATNQMAGDVQRSMGFLVAAGLDAKRAQAALNPIGKAATAAGADIEDLSRASFTLMDSLKIAPSQLGRALNILHVAGKEGNVELRDMAKTLPVLGASFVALKMQGAEAAATMGAALEIARKGAGDADEAANNLRNYMAKILAPATLKKAQKSFGLDLYKVIQDAQRSGGNPFEESLKAIMKATAGDAKKIGELFEDMQVQNFLKPMIQNWSEYERIKTKALHGAGGAIESDFGRMMETSAERMKAARASVDRLGKTIGMVLAPSVGATAEKLSHLVERVGMFAQENPRLVRGVVGAAVALTGLRVATLAVGYAWTVASAPVFHGMRFIAKWRADGAIKSMGALGPTATRAGAGLRIMGAAVAGMGVGSLLVAGAAVGALVAGALLVRKYWEPIKAWVGGVFQGIRDTAGPALAELGAALAPLKPAWDAVAGAIGSAWAWVSKLLEPVRLTPGEFEKATASGVKFGNIVGGAVAMIANKLRQVAELIGFVAKHWGKISTVGRLMSGGVTGAVGQMMSSLAGEPEAAPRPKVGNARAQGRPAVRPEAAPEALPPIGIRKSEAGAQGAPLHQSITNNFNLTRQDGESDRDFANRVVSVMKKEQADRHRLNMDRD
ncbi:phage tail tape measure protein [Luteimonas mephitis]|uniref:phage tail tape measure protein n=1 Tax=Luteimonas mephitis TaxID=83615 RepID=UPI003A9460C9